MKQETINRFAHFGLTVVFFAVAYLLSDHIQAIMTAPIIFWVAIGPAVLRLAHTISFNEIAEWLRHPFCEVVLDTAGGSESIEAKGGPFKVIGELLACPICSGTWSALFLYSVYSIVPKYGLVLVVVLGVAGVSEILHNLVCLMEWDSRDHREQAGTAWLLKNTGGYVAAFSPEKERISEREVLRVE